MNLIFIIPPTQSLSAHFYTKALFQPAFLGSQAPPPHLSARPYIKAALFFKGPASNKNKRSEWVWKRDRWRVGANEEKEGKKEMG